MKNYSLLTKLFVYGALVVCAFVLNQSPSYGQGRNKPRSLTVQQLDAIVKPNLAQCTAPTIRTVDRPDQSTSVGPCFNHPYQQFARTSREQDCENNAWDVARASHRQSTRH